MVVLEKGPHYTRDQFVHDEIAICRRDFFVPSIREDPHVVLRRGSQQGERSSMGWIGRCVGGGTVKMAGYLYRLHPGDFQMATRFGDSRALELADWPFSYQDLEPYYSRVDQVVGISGASGTHPFEGPRSKPYPLPPVDVHPMSSWIDRAGRSLGLSPFPSPRAIASRDYRGRQACVYCDFCGSYGCEVGAKSSTLDALLPSALATGRCEIRSEAFACQVEMGARGRVQSVVYHDASGQQRRIRARVVCIAASAIESARLLMLSATKEHPHGLANGNGLVGRHLQFSISAQGHGSYRLEGSADRRRILEAQHPFLGRSLQDFYWLREGELDLPKGGTIRFGFPHANPIFRALRLAHREDPLLWGAELKSRMVENFTQQRVVEFETFQDFLPHRSTFMDLDPEVKDRWGYPVARIHLDSVDHHAQAGRFLQARGLDLLEAAGATDRSGESVDTVTGHLVHGTCRSGTDPSGSVLNPFCRTHEVDNLYVVDGAFMPTAGGVPSTLTILANSFRVADHLLRRARAGEFDGGGSATPKKSGGTGN